MIAIVTRAIEILREMLLQRGCDLSDTILAQQDTAKDIAILVCRNKLHDVELGPLLQICFNLNERNEKNELNSFLGKMPEGPKSFIVVCGSFESALAKKLKQQIDHMPNVEMFELKELLFDPSKNELASEHILITDEQIIKALLVKHQVKSRTHIPLILRTDRMARHLGAKPGNLVKVININPSSGESVGYRCVV
jgi:DNA-directed RNA polymerase subunit H (RpoH/RPB5)